MNLYDNIRNDAIKNSISVSAFMIMLFNKHYNDRYINNKEKDENPK